MLPKNINLTAKQLLARKQEIIRRAYQNGAVFEWDPQVAANLDNLYFLLQILGASTLKKIWQKWPDQTKKAVLRSLLKEFNDDFEDVNNIYAREAYLLVTGRFKDACFGNGKGGYHLLRKQEAAEFSRAKLYYFFQIKLTLSADPGPEAAQAASSVLVKRDIGWLGFVVKTEFRKRFEEALKQMPELWKRVLTSEAWARVENKELNEKINAQFRGLFINTERAEQLLKLAQEASLSDEQLVLLRDIIVQVELKSVALSAFLQFLKEKISNNSALRQKILARVLQTHLAPLREYIPQINELSQKLEVKINEVPLYKFTELLREQEQEDSVSPEASAKPKPFARTDQDAPPGERELKQVPLRELLEQYPKLRQQEITRVPIKIKGFSEPVKPTIGNWLRDYKEILGAGRHDNVQRAEYLYRSDNGKSLNDNERLLLTALFRAYDTNTPVPFDALSVKIPLGLLLTSREKEEQKPTSQEEPGRVVNLKEKP